MPISEPMQDLLIQNLDWIERVCATLCRRNGVRGADAEDFSSWAKLRLLEDDCAILRKYRRESLITTYLTVVLTNLFREYRVALRGRWRASAAAERLGPLTVRLETLVRRDGCGVAQAVEILRTEGVRISTAEAARCLAELPDRMPLRPTSVGMEPLDRISGRSRADQRIVDAWSTGERERAAEVLRRGLEQLPSEDALILQMKFWRGMSVADVARELDLPQKPLYRRINSALRALRTMLEARGISREMVGELMEAA